MVFLKERAADDGTKLVEEFSGDTWESIKRGTYVRARFISKDKGVTLQINHPRVMGLKVINMLFSSGKMNIDFRKVKDVSSAFDSGNKERNWQIDLTNGDRLYLDSAV
jgi:hypothetical protein